MKIATTPTNHRGESRKKPDPYPYGWRTVERKTPDGRRVSERVPLTLEDILHPQVGDYRMHTEEHERFCTYLYDVLTARLENDPHAFVLHDVRVAWAHPEIAAHGPDIAVIFNVRQWQNWTTFNEVEEGTKPSLIIEIVSPSTRETDVVNKVEEYALVGVPLYMIVDIFEQKGEPMRRLLGYQLTVDGYTEIAPDARGWFWLEPVGVWLSLRGKNIACYDESGNLIADYVGVTAAHKEAVERATEAETRVAEATQARLAAEERAAEATQARLAAEERARQFEAELRRLRGEE